jgi:hypothetical protein
MLLLSVLHGTIFRWKREVAALLCRPQWNRSACICHLFLLEMPYMHSDSTENCASFSEMLQMVCDQSVWCCGIMHKAIVVLPSFESRPLRFRRRNVFLIL